MATNQKKSHLWIVLFIFAIAFGLFAPLLGREITEYTKKKDSADFEHDEYVNAIVNSLVLGLILYVGLFVFGIICFGFVELVYFIMFVAFWMATKNIAISKTKKKAVEEDSTHSGRVAILVVSSLSVLVPIPALMAVLGMGILIKKDLKRFSTAQFVLTCLISFMLAILLDVSLFIGYSLILLLAYIAISIIFFIWKREIRK